MSIGIKQVKHRKHKHTHKHGLHNTDLNPLTSCTSLSSIVSSTPLSQQLQSTSNVVKSSPLDLPHLWSTKSEHRGLISIFWVFVFFQFCLRLWENWKAGGSIMNWTIAKVFFRDGPGFWIIECLLIGTCYLGLLLHRLKNWIKTTTMMMNKRGLAKSNLFILFYWCYRLCLEISMIAIPSALMMQRGWHPMQRGAFLLHSIAMTLKIHSFLSVMEEHENQNTLISFTQFTEYLAMPTLVFDLSPPRTKKIRWIYALGKLFGILMSAAMLYVNIERTIYPALLRRDWSVTWVEVCISIFPSMLFATFLCFLLVFECCLNLLGELSMYESREFYSDFWNSLSFDDFSRKWNVPVHRFLYKHVYIPLQKDAGMSKWWASVLTFTFSSILHELVFWIMLGHGPHGYMFIMQMLQMPLTWLSKAMNHWIPEYISNLAFWTCMTLGPVFLAVSYVRSHENENMNRDLQGW